jgi:hypothetical protein
MDDATRAAISRLLTEAEHQVDRGTVTLAAGDEDAAHDRFLSARAIIGAVCRLLAPSDGDVPRQAPPLELVD